MSSEQEVLNTEVFQKKILQKKILQEKGNSIIYFRSTDDEEREKEIGREVLKKEEIEELSEKYSILKDFFTSFGESQGSKDQELEEVDISEINEDYLKLRRFILNSSTGTQGVSEEEIESLYNRYSRLREFIVDYRVENESRIDRLKDEAESDKRPLRLRKLSSKIIQRSKQEIVENALKIVCEQLNAQSAAIFLFSKNGELERIGIQGVDRNTTPLKSDWFKEESYKVGESFTGKAAQPKKGRKYGEIQYTRSLNDEELKGKNSRIYTEKLGPLKCAIAIPLNGRNKTYGVLRVVNKVARDPKTNKLVLVNDNFSQDDVSLLLLLAVYIGNVLSNFRRDIQTEIFKYLSHLLIQSSCEQSHTQEALYREVLEVLVNNPETAFKSGVLRSKNDDSKMLDVEATSLALGVSDNRDNHPRKIVDDGLLWLVVTEHKPLVLQNIQTKEQIKKFKNNAWIKENKMQAFGCFPILGKDEELLGTLSLYIGYNYEFHTDSIDFLQGIADLIASFMIRKRNEKTERDLQECLNHASPQNVDSSSQLFIESEFKRLAEQWHRETIKKTSITEKLMHPAYLQIIGLGPHVVPLILRELQKDPKNPNHWFLALKSLTRENPVKSEQRGKMSKMAEAWIEWGRFEGHVFN